MSKTIPEMVTATAKEAETNKSVKTRGLLEIHLAVVLFGFTGLFGKLIPVPPDIIAFGRVLIASITLFLALIAMKQKIKLQSVSEYALFGLLGVLLATFFTAFFHAIQDSTVAVGVIAVSTYPIFITFLEPIFFQKRLMIQDSIIACIAFLGIVLIVPNFTLSNTITQGVLWGITSGFAFGSLTVLNKKFVKNYSSVQVAFYQDIAASCILLPFVCFQQVTFSPSDMFFLLVLGSVCTALAHSLFIKGMTHFRAYTASIIGMLETVYGVILAVILLGEIPSLKELLGGGIIVGSALFITYSHSHSQNGSLNQLQVQVPAADKLQICIEENTRVMAATQSLSVCSARVSLKQRRPGGLKKVILRPYEHHDIAQLTSNADVPQKVQEVISLD